VGIDVDPDWWRTLFDEVYLITDSRSIDDAEITCREINFFSSLIPIRPDDCILDLCGGHGRHALELCRREYRDCTVLDYSRSLLNLGRQNAKDKQYPIRFIQGDARHTPFPAKTFDHVLILGNSLGYIMEPEADLKILEESLRLLKPRGWLLLDVSNGETARTQHTPQAWHEIGEDVVVCRQRELKGGRICAREMVLSKKEGLIRDKTYCIRLYDSDELTDLVNRAGFIEVNLYFDASAMNPAADVGCMNHRLVAVARRP
jgi:D-alanine-D-alanine ligase